MSEERTFFNEGGCLVTNARFTTGGQTYAMANVTSVKAVPGSITGALLLIAIGIFCVFGKAWVGTLFCFGLGALLIYFRKTYLVLHTAGAEQRALSSTSSAFIGKVVGAVNDAIVHRG